MTDKPGADAFREFDLTGRVAVVTGGAGLLGVEHGAALAECGATVILADVSEGPAQQKATRLCDEIGAERVVAVRMDVTDSSSVAAVRTYILERFGRLDVLINNAALDPKVGEGSGFEASRLETFPLERWTRELNVGLTGALVCSQSFGSWMAGNDGGVILNIASDLSVIAPDQRLYRRPETADALQPVKPVTYSVIKTGLIGLTRYLATYWAHKGVRVNALSPGGVFAAQPEEFVQRLTDLIPMGRMAERSDYRGAVQFLCSDASRYMTGQNVVIDGGRSVW